MKAKAKLKVPARLRDAMRHACVAELQHDRDWVGSQTDELERCPQRGVEGVTAAAEALINMAAAVAPALPYSKGDVTLEGDPSDLAYVCEAAIRKVVPALIGRIPGPITKDEGREAARAADLLRWAGEEAVRLHDLSHEAITKAKAKKAK